jgi:hypothetical protein
MTLVGTLRFAHPTRGANSRFNFSNSQEASFLFRLAMKHQLRHDFAFSRRDASESCRNVVPRKNRGRRESRVPNAPAASRAKIKKHTIVVTTGSPE